MRLILWIIDSVNFLKMLLEKRRRKFNENRNQNRGQFRKIFQTDCAQFAVHAAFLRVPGAGNVIAETVQINFRGAVAVDN